ncbi:MAG: dTDP-4-amino-4,6-dideoxyglucose formyltransferase [Lewinellaceae bacterium]|nr:dTDP-4-amino-4,6-dideoxyglucose formyltransferase [Saprospiraceae bacterium]MCB9338336.1 dTDP-4-amino-4,6-dideoxyglucose formyltransferase [Lewinellaceae bacterium]
MSKKILVVSDNEPLVNRFKALIERGLFNGHAFTFAFSPRNTALAEKYAGSTVFFPINVKTQFDEIIAQYDMVVSLHCKQLFPSALVRGIHCVNVHPGLNPHNRGWFPQVFSILNGKPCGATIHEIDELLDHGGIIAQKEVKIESWDTSLTAYNKILDAEMELIEAYMPAIIEGKYTTQKPDQEGNLNLKKDYDALCQIQLTDTDTFQNHLNRLRALTHGQYMNAYFLDDTGRKVYLKLELFPEDKAT